MHGNETAPVGQDRGGGKTKSAKPDHIAFVQRWRIAVCARESSLRATTRHVGLTLSMYANADGANAYPSEDALAAATALSTRAVRNSLAELDAAGWMRREKRVGGGKAWCWHVYTLLLPDGAERRSLPKRKGAELGSLPSASDGAEPDSGPNADGAERRSTRTGTSFQEGPEPRSADLEEELSSKSNLEKNALTSDGKAVLWRRAVNLLTKSGEKEKNARSIVGKLRSILQNDDERLSELVAEAERLQIVGPVDWLMKAARVKRPGVGTFSKRFAAPSEDQSISDADRALALLGGAPS